MKLKILLVDDDEIFREAIEKTLAGQGYDVATAPNGKVALELMSKKHTDMVISDIRMPEMDGVELIKAIRSKSNVPVILITGFSEILETKAAFELGANEFLAKPFKREDLLDAIKKCVPGDGVKKPQDTQPQYCRLGINDFITGRTIRFNVFVLLAGRKFIKIAHKGEDIAPERIKYYREKGLNYLYLKREDFREYVGFTVSLTKASRKSQTLEAERKLNLLRYTGEILNEQIRHEGVDSQSYESASAFVHATMDVLTDDVAAINVMEALNNHSDYLLVHSVGVSLYSILIAQALKWELAANKFKLAMGGLLHDVGMKEIANELIMKPRYSWSNNDVKVFEDHPLRGIGILNDIENVSDDIRDIVKQHHENCLSRGYPTRLKKISIHPMARLISVADEFCYRTVKNPQTLDMTPKEALEDMRLNCADQLDKTYFKVLNQLFESAAS